MRQFKFPRLVYNWLSAAGAFVAVISALLMLTLFIIATLTGETNPYFGIFLYMVLPPFLLGGLLLIPIGMYRTWRKWQRDGVESYPKWPYIDLNQRSHRNASAIFFFGTIIFLAMSAVGSYEAFHYTESVPFCGKTCHAVMKPEYTAYQNSAHARVACVECHVGPGAGWYAKSKLSGAYQVYATAVDVYPRPIPTPIANLRPAQETCEQCHWPEKFFGAQQKQFSHYMYDSASSFWPTNILIKTGGGDPKISQTAGIHWHMNIGFKVEYIARDERRQDIPWVKITERKTGISTIFQDTEKPLSEDEIKKTIPRVMDCVDCHNRPSHNYNSPDHAIDMALAMTNDNNRPPDIKKVAVEAIAQIYETEDQAMDSISAYIANYYRGNYPEYYEKNRPSIDSAIISAQYAFSQNIFPEMKVRWSEYPVNLGHFYSPGCMRCHAGKHASSDGKVVTRECTSCHTILSQGSGARAQMATSPQGLEFVHPDENSGEAWKEMGCHECHAGTQP